MATFVYHRAQSRQILSVYLKRPEPTAEDLDLKVRGFGLRFGEAFRPEPSEPCLGLKVYGLSIRMKVFCIYMTAPTP